ACARRATDRGGGRRRTSAAASAGGGTGAETGWVRRRRAARPNAGALRPGGHLRQLLAGGQHAAVVDRSVRLRVGGGQLERGRDPAHRDRRRNRLVISVRRLRGSGSECDQTVGRSTPGGGVDQSRSRRVPAIHLDGDARFVAENLYGYGKRREIIRGGKWTRLSTKTRRCGTPKRSRVANGSSSARTGAAFWKA